MGFYRKIEDAYYKILDFLNDKARIPVYDFFVKPIETRGVPSLPVACLLLLLVFGACAFLVFGGGGGGELKLTVFVKSTSGASLDGAKITVLADGNEVASRTSAGGKAVFAGLPLAQLVVRATKEGYSSAKKKISFPDEKNVRLELTCTSAACEEVPGPSAPTPSAAPPGQVYFADKAKLIVSLSDSLDSRLVDGTVTLYNANSNVLMQTADSTNGQAFFVDVDAGVKVYANVEADGYLPYDGSQKIVRLKAGKNTLSVKLERLKQGGCAEGSEAPCVTADGYAGTRTCEGGAYGECVATPNGAPRSCVSGATAACKTSDACNGTQSCNSTGFWGDCVKTLSPLQCEGAANHATSVVRALYANGTAIALARIDVYNASSTATPIIRGRYTDSNGAAQLVLSNAQGNAYFVVASKEGFFDAASSSFNAGGEVSLTLTPITPDLTANLTASAIDDERAVVNGASFAVFATNALGQTYRVGERTAPSSQNFVSFEGLRRGASVVINASKGASFGSATASLANANNAVTILLTPPQALLRFQAIDLASPGQPISAASFSVKRLGNASGSCAGVNCTVAIRSGRFYNATASAAGYSPNPFEFQSVKALPEQEINLTAEMISNDAVQESRASLQGVFEAKSGLQIQPGQYLVTEREYVARFQLSAKPRNEGTGLHVAFAEERVAYFTGYSPNAAVELGATDGEQGGCSEIQGANGGLSFDKNKYAWLDLEYAGSRSPVIETRFKVSKDAPLDPRTNQGTLTLLYRSFARRTEGGKQRIYRNPFDETLGVAPDSPLESGCDAASNEKKFPLAATACNDYACLWVGFAQGGEEGGDGFEAQSMKRVNPAIRDFKPLLVNYAVDFLKAPRSTTALKLVFNAPPGSLDFKNYSDPLNDSNRCGDVAAFKPAQGASWTLDLSRLPKCSNYGRFPAHVEGIAYAVPLAVGDYSDVSLVLADGNNALLAKKTLLKIVPREERGAPSGDSALLSFQLEQNQSGKMKRETGVSTEPFPAGAVEVNPDLTLKPNQNYSYVFADYEATANYDVYGAVLEISVADAASSPLKFVGVIPRIGGFVAARNGKGKVSLPPVDLKKGKAVAGRAFFAPVLDSSSDPNANGYAYGQINVAFNANDWDGAPFPAVQKPPKFVFVSKALAPPTGGTLVGWFSGDEDNCKGLINLTYSADAGLSFGSGCTNLALRITPMMPADAVPVSTSLSGKSVLVKFDAEDESCFKGFMTLSSSKEVSYDATKCNRLALKPHGNYLAGQTAVLKAWVTSEAYNENSPCPAPGEGGGGIACLNVTVKGALDESLGLLIEKIVLPSSAFLSDLGVTNPPELWAFTNNQQYPQYQSGEGREIQIEYAGANHSLQLATGATKVLAIKPGAFTVHENGGVAATYTGEGVDYKYAPTQRKSTPPTHNKGGPRIEGFFASAKAAAYWRSNKITMVCQRGSDAGGDCSTEDALRENIDYCCRSSVDAWRNMTEERYLASYEPCTKCVFFPEQGYNCDSRCEKRGVGQGGEEIGIGFVPQGASFFNGSSGSEGVLNCALAEGCSFSCTSFCGEGKCDDSGECVPTGNGAQGVKQVWKTRVVQNGWFNTTGDLQLVYFEAPAGQTQVRQKWPLAYFLGGGYGGEVNVKASSMENKLDSDYSSWVYSSGVQTDVEGCREDARDDLWFKGVYEFSRDEGEGSTAPLKVSVLTLDNKPESYIGYAPAGVDEGSACSKYNQPDVIDDAEHGISMKTVPLCALLWFDQTKAYGTCLDSVYSYEKDENHLSLTGRYFASVHARGTNPRSDCLDSSCPNAVKREGDDEPATDEMCKLHCLCVISTAGDPDSGLNENHGHQHLDANERPPFVVAKIGAVASQNGCANKRCDYDVWDSLGNLLTAVHADKDLSKVSNGECGVGKNPTEIEDSSTGNLDANSNVVCLLKHPDDYIVSIRERIYSYWLAGWHDRSDTEYDAEWTSAACQPD